MDNQIEAVNYAVFHYVRNEFFILAAVFALIIGLTVAFVVHEIKNDIS